MLVHFRIRTTTGLAAVQTRTQRSLEIEFGDAEFVSVSPPSRFLGKEENGVYGSRRWPQKDPKDWK